VFSWFKRFMITSPTNPTVKLIHALGTPAPGRRRAERAFVVEGVRAVEEALGSGSPPRVLLYDEAALGRTERGAALLARLRGLPAAQPATPAALAAAADTVHSQGVVGVFPFPDWPPLAPGGAGLPLLLVLDGLRDPGNLGTILRTAEAAGVGGVWLTPDSVDLYNPKVVRAGMGAHFRLPAWPDAAWPAILAALERLGVGQIVALDAAAPTAYYDLDWRGPAALVLGSEAHGLSPEGRAAATTLAAIPMPGQAESLNAALAAGIVLFEALRQRARA
jgi:TrmH family RNA methyltransferase